MTILESSHELLYDKTREAELIDILGINSMNDVTIIPWRPPTPPPDEWSFVFAKYYGPMTGTIEVSLFQYVKGDYFFFSSRGLPYVLLHEDIIGWAYPVTHPVSHIK